MEVLQIWVKNMESKRDIRKRVLDKRNFITREEWEENSHRIFKKVVAHPFFLDADSIYCYLDYRNEVGTKEMIEYAWMMGKKVAVPRISGDRMTFHYIESFEDTSLGYGGIMEPKEIKSAEEKSVLVILPGVAFDRAKHRIGYGKGFYDRYLAANPSYHTLALAFELQMTEHIPADEYDICPEQIITEEHIYV